jgi:choline kinase
MKIVILAAGMSKRMGIEGDGVPKPLLKIQGTSLIELNLDKLTSNSIIDEIIIVVGYKKELIMNSIGGKYNGVKVSYVINSKFTETNSSFSMWLAKEKVLDGFIVMNGDTLISQEHFDRILDEKSNCSVLIDIFFNKFTYEDLKVSVDNNYFVKNIGKDIVLDKNTYGSPAIYKFQGSSVKVFFDLIEENFIKPNLVKSLLSKVIQIYSSNFDVKAISLAENFFWMDIDTPHEYQVAVDYFTKNDVD